VVGVVDAGMRSAATSVTTRRNSGSRLLTVLSGERWQCGVDELQRQRHADAKWRGCAADRLEGTGQGQGRATMPKAMREAFALSR